MFTCRSRRGSLRNRLPDDRILGRRPAAVAPRANQGRLRQRVQLMCNALSSFRRPDEKCAEHDGTAVQRPDEHRAIGAATDRLAPLQEWLRHDLGLTALLFLAPTVTLDDNLVLRSVLAKQSLPAAHFLCRLVVGPKAAIGNGQHDNEREPDKTRTRRQHGLARMIS